MNEIKISKFKYTPDKYIVTDPFDNLVIAKTSLLDPYFFLSTYDFDGIGFENYELCVYSLLKITQQFFSKSSNVVELGSDYGYTAKRYIETCRTFHVFETDLNIRVLTKNNLKGINNIHIHNLTENKQLQMIDTEFMIIRDTSLFLQYRDIIIDKLCTILMKSEDIDLSYMRSYGYELYQIGVYILMVPFYFDKPINLTKYGS